MDTQLLRSQQDNRMTLEEMFESFDPASLFEDPLLEGQLRPK